MTKKDKVKYSKELLEISNEDLECAKVLCEKKKYSQAFFFLQQSSEKSTKVYGLMSDIIKMKDLRKSISHTTIKIYEKGVRKRLLKTKKVVEKLGTNKIFNVELDQFDEKNKDFLKMMEGVHKNNLLFTKELYQIKKFEKFIEEITKERKQIKRKLFTKKDIGEFRKHITKNVKNSPNFVLNEMKKGLDEFCLLPDKEIQKIMRHLLIVSLDSIIIDRIGFFISLLTTNHFDRLRYPDKDNPLHYYTPKRYFIRNLPKYFHYQEVNLKLLKKYFPKNKMQEGTSGV